MAFDPSSKGVRAAHAPIVPASLANTHWQQLTGLAEAN